MNHPAVPPSSSVIRPNPKPPASQPRRLEFRDEEAARSWLEHSSDGQEQGDGGLALHHSPQDAPGSTAAGPHSKITEPPSYALILTGWVALALWRLRRSNR